MVGSLKLPIKFQMERIRYEYKCPHCGHVNVRYEKCARIVCDACKREFVPSTEWTIR